MISIWSSASRRRRDELVDARTCHLGVVRQQLAEGGAVEREHDALGQGDGRGPVGRCRRAAPPRRRGPPASPRPDCASVVRPTGRPAKRRHSASRMARSTLSRPSSSTPNSSRPSLPMSPSMKPSPRTSAKSRTRRRSRLAIRGVPRERSAIRLAPSASMRHLEDAGRPRARWPAGRRARRGRAGRRSRSGRAAGPATSPVRVVAPTRVNSGQVQPDGTGRRALADQDVELEVLHGRVEDLLDRPVQAVDLVDEEHVAVLQVGEERGQVAGPDQDRARGDAQPDAHLGGHDAGQRGLAQAGRPGEQQVVDRLAPLPRRLAARSRGARSAGAWPTNSSRRRGRSPTSSASSAPVRRHRVDHAARSRSPSRRRRRARPPAPDDGQHLPAGRRASPAARASSRSARRSISSTGDIVASGRRARRGSRRGRSRARPARPGPRPARSAHPDAGRRRTEPPRVRATGRAGRAGLFSSISSRAAVLLARRRAPCTGCRGRPRAPPSTGRPATAPTGWPAPAPGPTPCAPSSTSKQRRSSSWTKP